MFLVTFLKKQSEHRNSKADPSKWVFKIKPSGVYRARLVALGYSQVPGIDFTDNFAPVVNDVTLRTALVLSIYKRLDMEKPRCGNSFFGRTFGGTDLYETISGIRRGIKKARD